MADPNDQRTDGAPPTSIHIEKKRPNWLAWIALLLGVLALLLALSRCHREQAAVVPAATPTSTSNAVVATTPNAGTSTVLAGTSGLGTYLAGNEPAPRRFVFEKLNFDTSKSDIRSADAAEIDAVATVLKAYPKAHIRIAGYADARGSEPANVSLGKARADSVKKALVAKGIDGTRIETGSGGEGDPVDTNATASGRAENRRTELAVTSR